MLPIKINSCQISYILLFVFSFYKNTYFYWKQRITDKSYILLLQGKTVWGGEMERVEREIPESKELCHEK